MKYMPKYNLSIILLMWLLGAALTSCGPVDAEQTLQQAENELNFGNVEQAASSCDLLADSTATTLSPTQLCRVAIMYAKISDLSEKQDYMASAAKCLDRAMEMDVDSIDHYIESLNIEDQSYVRVIREVTQAINSPCDISRDVDYEETDEYDDAQMSSSQSKNTASL